MASFWLNVGYVHGIFLSIWCALVNDHVHGLKSYWIAYMNAWANMGLIQLAREGNEPYWWFYDETKDTMNIYAFMTHMYYVYKVFV